MLEVPGQSDCETITLLFNDPFYVVAASRDGAVRILDTSSGACRHTMSGHTGRISGLASNGNTLASGGGSDQTIRLWDIATGDCLKVFQMHGEGTPTRLAFDPTGHYLAASIFGGERIADIWDITQGSVRMRVAQHRC